uniref:Autophagy-related protein 27 n=2 Tax=Guillardia theta TaxID=55529 RepID=A0A6U6CFP7_GUITH|mmetsp:Transcript_45733/g.143533  ORF Transcript_45733/g.143533 Transcript_45733/m.143533 type:complete len:301 (+) Transcript_45733:154-1056(+)
MLGGSFQSRLRERPEFATFFVFVILLAVIGFVGYYSIAFQLQEVEESMSSHPCVFEHHSKSTGNVYDWDLSQLQNSNEKCTTRHCRDYSLTRGDEVFFFNICRNTMNLPDECIALYKDPSKIPRGIGYQTADGVCYKMGDASRARWSLLDPRRPSRGVKLDYGGGSRCDGKTSRSISFHFECDRTLSVGRPIAVYGDCEFVVRWRTGYACPRKPSTFLPIFFWVLVAVGLYLIAVFYYNVRYRNLPASMESFPHIKEIRLLGAAVIMLVEQVSARIMAFSPQGRDSNGWRNYLRRDAPPT